ncbi:hypothetical protein SISNIDRAFT_549915 [Sistotremastrum niveocremeum HHB9708]|uniref:DH domain-containing protein n=1 Tax=Sistotremastrum niveocremeum HHB9708 TaxID=1314777 RepID=A0A164U362_9AGAM|nr:hypothetical protein SISNIDRAFT_549915 [Sistotremastrum niveocremeum HHB9708]
MHDTETCSTTASSTLMAQPDVQHWPVTNNQPPPSAFRPFATLSFQALNYSQPKKVFRRLSKRRQSSSAQDSSRLQSYQSDVENPLFDPPSSSQPLRTHSSPSLSSSSSSSVSPKKSGRKLAKKTIPDDTDSLHLDHDVSTCEPGRSQPHPVLEPLEPSETLSSPPTSSSSSAASSPSEPLTPASNPSWRPLFLRTESSTRRWTLAVTTQVPDEVVVQDFDNWRSSSSLAVRSNESSDAEDSVSSKVLVSDQQEDENWKSVRRALFVCRELVRTERNYLQYLQEMEGVPKMKPLPPMLQQHVPSLMKASQSLSRKWESDASVEGISSAFLDAESALEEALSAWCSVVGHFFSNSSSMGSKSRKSSSVSLDEKDARKERSMSDVGRPLRQARRSLKATVPPVRPASESAVSSSRRSDSTGSSSGFKDDKRWTLQDLVIQPTQRVTRYVLLFQDLAKQVTSTSPERGLVERALEAATRIAKKCDLAQGNAEFALRHPRTA